MLKERRKWLANLLEILQFSYCVSMVLGRYSCDKLQLVLLLHRPPELRATELITAVSTGLRFGS